MPNYTLGLDIGSKSIGWAILDKNGKKIINLGVRVFPEGVDRDTKGLEISKNKKRREARGSRRIKTRRKRRREKLIMLLKENGLLPNDNEMEQLLTIDPYQIRAKGIDEKLNLFELGRAFYHINQRRGFKSNRKSGKEKEDGKVKKEISQLQHDIKQSGCRSLGEYLYTINPVEQRIRERYTLRDMYEDEFDILWNKQKEFYPETLTEELKKIVKEETIFYQRPMKWDIETIGKCDLEDGEKRCPKGDWYARRFRIYQDINNLLIQNMDGSEQSLTGEQRQKLLNKLFTSKEMTFDQIRKLFGFLETQKFNLEQDGKNTKIKGDDYNCSMRKIFGKRWDDICLQEKVIINDKLLDLEDVEMSIFLKENYNLDNEQVEKIFKIPLPQKYMSFSRKAIEKLLEFMEQGAKTHEAIEVCYGEILKEKKQEQAVDTLPIPDDLRNPLVNRALNEVRKLTNCIVKEYGKPREIKIEMARDVKGSAKEREELHWRMLDNQKRNEEVRNILITEFNINNPSRDDIIKYKLWEECAHVCPYTGKVIGRHQLFSPEFQIEHILPFSRSLDDSYMNKTLCFVNENRLKDEKTPYEFYNGKEQYDQIKQRITILPYPKRKKFLQENIELDEMIKRELNDTRYITKEVIRYLGDLGVVVKGTKGKITSDLRHCWGLDSILDGSGMGIKNRDDHRHHIIDAAVTAVTESNHLHRLADTKYSNSGETFGEPWDGFRKDLESKIKNVIVSHRPTKRVRGQLHEETNYGITGKKDEKGQDVFVYRKKLEDLTPAMVNDIVDEQVKEIVKQRLEQFNIGNKGSKTISKDVWKEPLYMKCNKKDTDGNMRKIPIKKVRVNTVANNMILLNDKEGKPYRAVSPGSNHHIEIFEYTDNKGNIRRDGRVITLFEAVKRKKNREPVIKNNYGDGNKFICSLSINEMFLLQLDHDKEQLFRVQKISSNCQIFFRHHTFAGDLQKQKAISRVPNTLNGYKVIVDLLGRICKTND